MTRPGLTLGLISVGALALLACACTTASNSAKVSKIGLFTTLPILWQETADIRGALNNETAPHWAMPVLRENGVVVPKDTLASLKELRLLIMAQPRPLSPQENVALDRWVRGGGRALLFADPLLTAESAYALGDRRRPQDVVLLSPILARWGLELNFDDAQPVGETEIAFFGNAVPVNLPGRFVISARSRQCVLIADGIGAQCRIGKGQVLAIADAALLEDHQDSDTSKRAAAFNALIKQVLPDN